MAKFLNTRQAVAEIESLIRTAEEKLILVSPYLKLSKDFKELLAYRNSQDKVTTVIFGKQELNPEEMDFLQSLRFVVLKYHEDLHAKCYLNESKMVITSLNLYQFSMANNKEMGVLVDKNDENDSKVYNDAFDEIKYIDINSVKFELRETNKKEDKVTTQKKQTLNKTPKGGKYYSTSALSKELEVPSGELFEVLEDEGWITRRGKSWSLTPEGEEEGGIMKKGQYGEYVAWSEGFIKENAEYILDMFE